MYVYVFVRLCVFVCLRVCPRVCVCCVCVCVCLFACVGVCACFVCMRVGVSSEMHLAKHAIASRRCVLIIARVPWSDHLQRHAGIMPASGSLGLWFFLFKCVT